MNKTLSLAPLKLSLILGLLLIALGGTASAQTSLQNTTSSLQTQTGQTQTSANTQNQTGTLQENRGQDVLSQTGTKPLGVVSDPKQATPQAVVQPSESLKTEVPTQNEQSNLPYLVGALVVITVLIVLATYLTSSSTEPTKPKAVPQPKPVKSAVIPELNKPIAPKKKKTTRRKRKKASR